MKIASIIGARPQFIKLAPIIRAIQRHNNCKSKLKIEHKIIHTGQHYDYEMNKVFFDELGILEPDYNLGVGSGSQAWQTGEMLKKTEEVLAKEKPGWVLVYGDTNSTLAGSLATAKLHFPVAHIEAGLRSYDKRMPEEINRVLTDHCSDILFCPTENAVMNLQKEGFANIINKGELITSSTQRLSVSNSESPIVINVGDIMYDAFLTNLEIAEKKSSILEKLKLINKDYYLVTIHRANNTDSKDRLRIIIEALIKISKENRVIFPIHPRTRKKLKQFHIFPQEIIQLSLIDPVSYFDMLILEKNANKIITDSGGIQKEAYFLRVPCVTLRGETEWVETIESGWNILTDPADDNFLKNIKLALNKKMVFSPSSDKEKTDYYGNGNTANQIINALIHFTENPL